MKKQQAESCLEIYANAANLHLLLNLIYYALSLVHHSVNFAFFLWSSSSLSVLLQVTVISVLFTQFSCYPVHW